MLIITNKIIIPNDEITLSAIRSQGAGGQNVNKVASAIHLRFDITSSSLPDHYKQRLLASSDGRITKDGVIVIKAQHYRTQDKNRADALLRLQELIKRAGLVKKVRRKTKPSLGAKKRRVKSKTLRGKTKELRSRVTE